MRKRAGTLAFIVLMAGATAAMAAERGTPEYEKMKELKRVQREQREAKRAAEKANPEIAKNKFWSKEAERSGMAGTGAMFSRAIFKVVPLDKPNARKEK